jgi:glycosyltransferase involved in cell wall biosynthesis
MKILFADHFYHKATGSSKFFQEKLIEAGCRLDVKYDYYESEYGTNDNKDKLKVTDLNTSTYSLIVVWQTEKTLKSLSDLKDINWNRILFIPMYDSVAKWEKDIWELLVKFKPKILSFSIQLSNELFLNGIDNYYCKHYLELKKSKNRFFDSKKINIYYWHRINGGERLLIDAIKRIGVESIGKITIKNKPDPNNQAITDKFFDALKKNNINIHIEDWYPSKLAYIKAMAENSLFIAPRQFEGIGLPILEALQNEVPVYAWDAATANEYVVDGCNGFLYRGDKDTKLNFKNLSLVLNQVKISYKNKEHYLASKSCYSRLGEYLSLKQANSIKTKPPGKNAQRGKLLTVVTVVKDDPIGFEKTAKSILAQDCQGYEWIVIDGNSTEKNQAAYKKYIKNISKYISEADGGPYFAMNKAANEASKEYIIFLNAGDEFSFESSISSALDLINKNTEIAYFDYFYVKNNLNNPKSPAKFEENFNHVEIGEISYAVLDSMPCHQAVIYKTKLLKSLPFDTGYRIASDHDHYHRSMKLGVSFQKISYPLSRYHAGGLSSIRVTDTLNEWRKISLSSTKHKEKILNFYKKAGISELCNQQKYDANYIEEFIRNKKVFNENYYRQKYGKDIKDPIRHFCTEGFQKLYNPSPLFITNEYIEHNKDVAEALALLNPFFHYLVFGQNEGRFPSSLIYQMQTADNGSLHRTFEEISEFLLWR